METAAVPGQDEERGLPEELGLPEDVTSVREQRLRDRVGRTSSEQSVSSGPDELTDALASLPYRQRAALVLRFYDDLSEEAAAVVLGCRPGTVGSLVHRGLAQLKRVIEL
jgi:RNA polymerase sigma factor (sigma-70 family)